MDRWLVPVAAAFIALGAVVIAAYVVAFQPRAELAATSPTVTPPPTPTASPTVSLTPTASPKPTPVRRPPPTPTPLATSTGAGGVTHENPILGYRITLPMALRRAE